MKHPNINCNGFSTSKRNFDFETTAYVMGILNLTPDSFSDGGRFKESEQACKRALEIVQEGADIVDIGGESTRPGGKPVPVEEEIKRVIPAIKAITENEFTAAISIDTWKSEVAKSAVLAGAEIINDISGLRFDERIAAVAAEHKTGLILMHLTGSCYATMHEVREEIDILEEVSLGFEWSIAKARSHGVKESQICLDIGIGFSKTLDQNLELIANLDKLIERFPSFPLLVGVSRKSFIGKLLDNAPVEQRFSGSIAAGVCALLNGAKFLRVHDVKPTVDAIRVVNAISGSKSPG